MQRKKLAIVTTHPIQYNAPLFKYITNECVSCSIKVFYTLNQEKGKRFDPDFGIYFSWDVPLLEGYDYTFVNNISVDPHLRSFRGIINPTLIGEIEEWKADALLVFGWSFSSHLKAIRYFHGKIPVLFRGDSNLLDEPAGFSVKKFLRRNFLRWVYKYIDYALYVGEANKQYYIAHGLNEDQLLFSPHAIDNDRFSGNDDEYEHDAAAWKTRLEIKEDESVLLFAGKLTKKKDPEVLIKAFLALDEAKVSLIIIGSGELESELKERYKNHTKIFFIPFQNQSIMPVVYRLGDIFVLPSKGPGETWGLAVNEAMASGRGVIVSDKCGCAADLVKTGDNGYVFRSGNVESLMSCMKSSLRNFKNLGNYSYRIIQQSSYSAFSNQLDTFFKKQLCNEER